MLLENFQTVCKTTPDALAVVAGMDRLTYAELDRRATCLAAHLVASGMSRNSLIAVYMQRKAQVLVCMLGIMKCGAAYTVVEDDGAAEENHNRLQAIHAELTICEAKHAPALRERGLRTSATNEFSADPPQVALPTIGHKDIAYVLFTSGSTGKPKGVSVSHGNVAHYAAGIREALDICDPLRYAHVSTLAADLGNTSLLLSLTTGGCLHLVDAQLRKDPVALRDYLIKHDIQFVKITPTHWSAIFSNLGAGGMKGLRLQYLVLGGEALTVAFARKILESGIIEVLSNHYGPTETTVGVTAYPIRNLAELDAIASECVPIGRPFGQTILRVRDDAGNFFANDVRGELYIGGPSVAAGYRNDSATTEKSFLQLESGGAERFYKTGDYVAVDQQGVVLFLGRIDRQVKVNGYRVELEHIESVLRTLSEIEEGAVFFVEVQGRQRLVAAVLTRNGVTDVAAIKHQLESALPDYMVPKILLPLEAFPRNANGKIDMRALQTQIMQRLGEAPAHGAAIVEQVPASSPLHEEIRGAWRQYLHDVAFADDDSFFDAGGDSLDAIELIAELQLKGYQVTAHSFLGNPTVNGLVAIISNRLEATEPVARKPVAEISRGFSAAQDFFLRQQLTQADHYNQAILLECGRKVDAELMHKAVTQLFQHHLSLRTGYGQDAEGRYARLLKDEPEDAFEVIFMRKQNDEDAVRKRIESVSQSVHESLSLEHGQVFKTRLFKFESLPDQLLLVAHHIAIDLISWRILISELSKLYSDMVSGAAVAPDNPNTFQDWIAYVDQHQDTLYAKDSEWLSSAIGKVSRAPRVFDPHNTEGTARTIWLGFSRAQTQKLTGNLVSKAGAPLHVLLLSAFAQGYAQRRQLSEVAVDVESHGRVTFDDTIDVSRVVGWHTSTFPVFLDVEMARIDRTIAATAAAINAVPNLGVAYGVKEKHLAATAAATERELPSAPLCYNYLGNINFNHDDRFSLTPSTYAIGRARGGDNHRGHGLKFSGRIIDDRLILDLSFPGTTSVEEMTALMENVSRDLLDLCDLEPTAAGANLLHEPGTRTGLISYVPKALIDAIEVTRRTYRSVLLTGATGYVGVHVLRELVAQSQVQVYCLVRGREAAGVTQRLREIYEFYFPGEAEAIFDERITVLEGDVSLSHFGVEDDGYAWLSEEVDAIYHFAADTRLFGREEDFQRNNVFSVQQCIDFAKTSKRKDLHYMSTLAVCGVNPGHEVVEFSEDCGDIGQEFQNHYEATKFRAEGLVQEFRAAGGAGFIYRSGNVSGHSRTGRFQKNAKDNRFVQFLSACVKSGKLPRSYDEPIVLSPIDEVAAGIVAISLDHATNGGVFHVDNVHAIRIEQVFDALRGIGIEFEDSEHESFLALFTALCDHRSASPRDPELALGLFWAMRKPRNIRFNNANTHELLSRLGCSFSELDDQWIASFVGELVDNGVFAAPGRDDTWRRVPTNTPAHESLAFG